MPSALFTSEQINEIKYKHRAYKYRRLLPSIDPNHKLYTAEYLANQYGCSVRTILERGLTKM